MAVINPILQHFCQGLELDLLWRCPDSLHTELDLYFQRIARHHFRDPAAKVKSKFMIQKH